MAVSYYSVFRAIEKWWIFTKKHFTILEDKNMDFDFAGRLQV